MRSSVIRQRPRLTRRAGSIVTRSPSTKMSPESLGSAPKMRAHNLRASAADKPGEADDLAPGDGKTTRAGFSRCAAGLRRAAPRPTHSPRRGRRARGNIVHHHAHDVGKSRGPRAGASDELAVAQHAHAVADLADLLETVEM